MNADDSLDARNRNHAGRDCRAASAWEDTHRLVTLLSNLPGMVYRCANDPNWTMEFVSEGCEPLTGYPATELLAPGPPTYAGIIHPEDRRRIRDEVQEAVAKETPFHLTYRIVTASGALKWVYEQGAAVYAGGAIVALEGFITDITARREADDARREAERQYREIFEGVQEAMYRTTPAGRFLTLNPAGARMLGYDSPEEVAATVTDSAAQLWVYPFERGRFMELIEREGSVRGFEFQMRRKDGTILFGSTSAHKVCDPSGATLYYEGFVQDITERKRAEEQLQISEARFRTLTEDAPVAISMGREGRVVYANPMYLRMFGFERADDLYGSQVLDRYALQCREEVAERARLRAEGVPVPKEYEAIGRRADGSEFPMLVAAIQMEFAEGRAVCGFITDLTALKQLEQERERMEQQLRQAQKMESIGRLAGGVAHDFNNLLTIINGYSKLALAELRAGDPLRAHLEEVYQAGERAAELTRQLLAFSRMQVLQPRVLDLNCVVGDMQSMLRRLLGEDVAVQFALSAESPTVRADQHQLEQVIMNLAVNSRDAMPRGGRLLIETSFAEPGESHATSLSEMPTGRYAVLAVSDNGIGMDEATKRQIFEPFFTTKGVGKGTGLGLAMVHGIVVQSGGYIAVSSEPSHGTTFRIYLPAVAETPTETEKPAANPELRGSETILVVEDHPEVRSLVVASLEAYGYRVIPAADAADALMIFGRQGARIDLVLTDVVMPHMSGRELKERLTKVRPGIKSLFMSGYATDVLASALEEDTCFIQKPFSPEELAGRVREVLARPVAAPRILDGGG
jgi:two-component system, cell cycle sensor histidine kinase and response regulator CckA